MKNRINKILFTLIFVLYGSLAIHAQNIVVLKDSVYNYFAITQSDVKSYNWFVNGILDASRINKISVKWTGVLGSAVSLAVNGIGGNGCSGNNYITNFVLVDKFPYSVSITQTTNTVPQTTSKPNGGNNASFTVAITGTTVALTDSFTIWYSIDNVPQMPVSFAPGESTGKVLLNTKNYQNYTSADITKKISIAYVKISSKDKLNYPTASMPSAIFTVYQSPKLESIY